MLAVELHPEAGDARRYCEALQGRGVLAKDTHKHTIRIAPPLVITCDQVDWALERIEATLRQSQLAAGPRKHATHRRMSASKAASSNRRSP